MSKVTYILGAGASYGERATPSSYLYSNTFLRGLPVVSELKVAIETQIHLLEGLDAKISLNNLGITQEEADILIKELKKLDTKKGLLSPMENHQSFHQMPLMVY